MKFDDYIFNCTVVVYAKNRLEAERIISEFSDLDFEISDWEYEGKNGS